VIQILENKRKEGIGFSPTSCVSIGTFYSAGFINAIDAAERSYVPAFVVPGGTVRNWEAIDIPLVMHASV
jgi:selenophosphate synthase